MAKFLNTEGISYHLGQMIENAEEKLILISPYLKVNDKIKIQLEDKNRLKIDVRIVYGKSELQPDEVNWLKKLEFIRSSYSKNLHAKCYINEKEALVTSMNLYEFSQVNNIEMGIHVTKDEDPELYKSISSEVQRIIRYSDEVKISVEKVPRKDSFKKKSKSKKADAPEKGYCIRCKKDVKPNPKVPYCRDCYNTWKKVGDKGLEEKYCQLCGKSNKSSLTKPSCYKCYKKYKDVVDFPLN